MKNSKSQQLRSSLAFEAARLMYEEGIQQYFTAKQVAAKRLLGRIYGKKVRHRPQDLPSNGEIKKALLHLVQQNEGNDHFYQLFAMRVIALEVMYELKTYTPCLIGSVSTGHVRKGSDIDLHLFTDSLEELEKTLIQKQWNYELNEVAIQKNGQIKLYTHVYLNSVFPIELSIYPTQEQRVVSRSSTDGNPIVRLKANALEKLLQIEHEIEWQRYLSDGVLRGYRK
ncbi:MAG: nucleotidyltransferase [Gammaproteobacteria bacterium]|nr:nucleotidyltransferase [Gammaproteobacteria bacterium]